MEATYISVWDSQELRSSCEFDPKTNDVTNIEVIDVEGMDLCVCTEEFVELVNGEKITEFTIDGEEI